MEGQSEVPCSVLDFLENGLYFNFDNNSDVKTKIVDFSNFLNCIGRIPLLNASRKDCDEIVFLLLTLTKNIKHVLSELGKSHRRIAHPYLCGECNEETFIKLGSDVWSTLQGHEHVEMLYSKFLNGTLQIDPTVASEPATGNEIVPSSPSTSLTYIDKENSNSDIEQYAVATNVEDVPINVEDVSTIVEDVSTILEDVPTHNSSSSEDEELGSNTFRFNFKVHYDPEVENKLYPESITKAVQRIDKVPDYSIQRAGPFKGVCLVCCCDLMSRSRISKTSILDHVMGQRHLKCSRSPDCLSYLQAYHEAFLNFELSYQAHQVYFRPETNLKARCTLCNIDVKYTMIINHVHKEKHKLKVTDLFKKKINLYYLTNVHVLAYGIVEEMVDIKQEVAAKQVKEKAIVTGRETREKASLPTQEVKNSESSNSSDSKESQHRIVKSVVNPKSIMLSDWVPYRFREHMKFLKSNGNLLVCQPCKVNLAKDTQTLKKHFLQPSHQKTCSKVLAKYSFYCEICNLNFSEEITWSKHFSEGPNRHATMAESRKSNVTEYECTDCNLVIFGDQLSLSRHITARTRKEKKNAKKEIKLPDPLKLVYKSRQTLEMTSRSLTNEANDSLVCEQQTKDCCAKLEATLAPVYGQCRVYPFGSRISGLGNKNSDLDVFIDIGDMYMGLRNQDALTQVQIVRKAVGTLSKQRDEFQDVFAVPTARTPIVKLYHKRTKIECDLSFRHGLSVENTKFIRFCIDIQPITQPFILMLKQWSDMNRLAEHITTYALAMMAIFYLQINKYLLPITKIKELNYTKSKIINGWETINYTVPVAEMKKHIVSYEHSIHRLLKDFFDYYSKFVYEKDVICPLLGYTITKDLFSNNGKSLPSEMNSYVQQLNSKEPEQFRFTSTLCIQDPFDLSHNLTKACQPGTVNKLKILCDLSKKHLDTI